ncbi:Myc-type, basic helix-loop-helix [Sesbania bispinosa]|nr:Myc-type, basic helix-loop-helix [Sesbania bispinosa]
MADPTSFPVSHFPVEQSWDTLPLHMEMGDDEKHLFEQCHSSDDEEFLRDILQQPALSFEECQSESFVQNNNFTATTTTNEMACSSQKRLHPSSSSPKTFILSFDKCKIIPASPEPLLGHERKGGKGTRFSKSNSSTVKSRKGTLELENLKFGPKQSAIQGGKQSRSGSNTVDHVIAERKRRQDLAEKFIALSSIVPGLKKIDKTSIVCETISYVKQLHVRVTELEQPRDKTGNESLAYLKKTSLCGANETKSEDCCRPSELLPDVKARVLKNEVIIWIHCKKENGIELKILDLLENLQLCVTGSSVLPFGNSTLNITILAQMDDAYRMTVVDLVENVRQVLFNDVSSNIDS